MFTKMVLIAVLAVSLVLEVGYSARILALVHFHTKSHFIVMEPWLEELAARGHQVTVFSTFPKQTPLPNYTDVNIGRNLTRLTFPLETIRTEMKTAWEMQHIPHKYYRYICDLIKEPPFQNILKNKDQYDLVVTELLGTDCMTYFAYKLNLPLISYTTTVTVAWSSERFGIPDNPAYIPNMFLGYTSEMTLFERAYNFILYISTKVLHGWWYPWEHQSVAEEGFGESLPPLRQVVANTSLLLVNSYHALTQSRPFPPNVIEVGGIHIRERKPLPQNLETILEQAKHGVLLVSFGSMVQTNTLPKSVIALFMKVFSQLPQTVVFKYEDDWPNTPQNVFVMKWLPQRDILEHDNVVAFFGHGGLASTIEAVQFNKPLLGIPFFADQFVNMKYITQRGAGIELDLDYLTEENVASAVREIISNPKYKEGMRRLSLQFRDRPMSALQSAVYWTEYVIRHQGAPHLRPASVRLPLYQYLLLDVIALLLTTLTVVALMIYYLVKLALNSLKHSLYIRMIDSYKQSCKKTS